MISRIIVNRNIAIFVMLLHSGSAWCGYQPYTTTYQTIVKPWSDSQDAAIVNLDGCIFEQKHYVVGHIIAFPDEGTAIACFFYKGDRPRWLGIEMPSCLKRNDIEC